MNEGTKKIINQSRRLLLESTMTEQQIVEKLFVSETTLRQLYVRYLGISPKKYIRKVKLKKAKTKLRITNSLICEIASEIGYTNMSKFSNAFKSVYGITPSNYRKKCRFGVEK